MVAKNIVPKAWAIGFTEAKGYFQLEKLSDGKIIHSFKLYKKNMPLKVYLAISRILGIKFNIKNLKSKIETKNSRAISNIIKYFNNNLKGLKSLEFKVWARSFEKYKSDFSKLDQIRNKFSFTNLI